MNAFRKNLNLLFVVVVAVRWDHLKAGLVALVDIHEIHLSTQILHLIGAHCQWPIFIVAGNSFTMHSSRSSRKKYSQQSITLLVGISRTTSALQTARNDWASCEYFGTTSPTWASISRYYQLYKSKFMISFNALSIAASYQLPHKTTLETDTKTPGLDQRNAPLDCCKHNNYLTANWIKKQ